jgi:hypothetical protein
MPPSSAPILNILPGLVLTILLIALPLAFGTSLALLKLYRRAVIKAMTRRAVEQSTEPAVATPSISPHYSTETLRPISFREHGATLESNPQSERLYGDLVQAPWQTAIIYAVAGLSYALVMTIVFLAAIGDGFYPLRFLVLFWYYAWPVVVTFWVVAASTWRARLIVVGVYFLILILLAVAALATNAAMNWGQLALLWLLTNFVVAVVLLAFFNRQIRAVGPLVLAFMIFAVTGALFTPLLADNNRTLLVLLANFGDYLGLNATGILIGLFLLGFLVFGGIAWLLLQQIGTWYRNKWISEQSITLDAIWLLFGIFQSIGLIGEGERWFLASLVSFFVYKLVTWAGFKLLRREPPPRGVVPKLLVLRVFSLGKRSERLFDVLSMHWRFVGSIRLIAGPDLATSTMEPHEFLDFLSGKLARRFIDSAQTLDLRLSEMDLLPDHDGQFRVNDFFCHDETWRMVLSRLVRESDAVLMDLRGFTAQNTGCIYEIGELINLAPLGQVIFLIDDTTDEAFLRQILQQSLTEMRPASPNRQLSSGAPCLLRLQGLGTVELNSLLQALAGAVQSVAPAQAVA